MLLALDEEDISRSLSITSFALLPYGAVNGDITTQSVSRGFPSRCLRVCSFVVYGVSKLRHFKNGKEETETKIIFLVTWAHNGVNSDLAKDISSRLLCN